MSGGQDDRRTWEGPVGSLFGASLTVMGILAAVMALLPAQIERFSEFATKREPLEALLTGAVVCFGVCGWCALFSALFLNGRVVGSVLWHRRIIFWPMNVMIVVVVAGVIWYFRNVTKY